MCAFRDALNADVKHLQQAENMPFVDDDDDDISFHLPPSLSLSHSWPEPTACTGLHGTAYAARSATFVWLLSCMCFLVLCEASALAKRMETEHSNFEPDIFAFIVCSASVRPQDRTLPSMYRVESC